jgi:ATP-dependent Clp protease ATP-binding subunit ClpC
VRARREAAVLRHSTVGTDHLLLGVLSEDAAAAPLQGLGLGLDGVRAAAAELRGPGAAADEPRRAEIPISPRAREALEQSLREALRLGDERIGAQHILLALLRDDQSHAVEVLDRLGLAAAAIEQRVAR